jgi:hypothetical protein
MEEIFEFNSNMFDFLSNESFVKNLKSIIYYDEEIINGEIKLDLFAKKYLGSSDYFWIIGLYNDIVDPNLYMNGTIKIPKKQSVQKLFRDVRIKREMHK